MHVPVSSIKYVNTLTNLENIIYKGFIKKKKKNR